MKNIQTIDKSANIFLAFIVFLFQRKKIFSNGFVCQNIVINLIGPDLLLQFPNVSTSFQMFQICQIFDFLINKKAYSALFKS